VLAVHRAVFAGRGRGGLKPALWCRRARLSCIVLRCMRATADAESAFENIVQMPDTSSYQSHFAE